MYVPTLLAVELIGEQSGVTIGLASGLVIVALAYGEARVHISGLREWKERAMQQIDSLQKENADIKGRADLQGQQINHILAMLAEVRDDVKRLLRRDVA
jgi:uncharacterized protein YjdB